MLHDLRLAVRSLRQAPGFALAAILTLAIGTGAASAVFTVLHAVLLRPLPYADPDRLVVLLHDGQFPVSPADYLDYRREARAYERVSAAQAWSTTLVTGGPAERLPALQVSADLFTTLGVPAALGRTFLPDEDQNGRDHVVVLSDSLWRERFAGDTGVIGRPITLDGAAYTVVGVMPPSFRFAPFWATTATLWRPLPLEARTTDRNGRSLRVFARLRSGVTRERAQAEASAIAARLAAAYPDSNAQLGIAVVPLRDKVVSDVRPTLWLLAATVGLVLLVACVNVASLQLVRNSGRRKELAVRAALGAGRRRLVFQLLAETIVLSGAGGIAGLLLATWAVAWIGGQVPAASLPPHDPLGFNGVVALFSAGVILATGFASGLAPALHLSRAGVHDTLQGASRGATEGAGGRQLRRVLLGVELALALALLAGAGLMGRTLLRLQAVDPGFDPHHLLTFTVSVGGTAHDEARLSYFDRAADAVAAIPGVISASAINHLPLAGDDWHFGIQPEGRPEPPPGDEPTATWRVVRRGYFSTMRLPLVAGRDFDARDRAEGLPVCIVNETMARRHWPGEDPVGRRVGVGGRNRIWLTVVGVSTNARQSEWTGEVPEEIYVPYAQHATEFGSGELTFVVRTAGDPAGLARAAQRAVWSVDANVPVSRVATMEQIIADQLWRSRVTAVLLGGFAAVALVLAALGVYGVSAYSMSRRTREMGIRVALGARPAQVISLALGEIVAPVVVGVAAGCGLALTLARVVGSLLYGVGPSDPVTFVGAPLALGVIALLAAWLPARRASRVDPAQVLRQE
jgi:putative ABC transport system permease protein